MNRSFAMARIGIDTLVANGDKVIFLWEWIAHHLSHYAQTLDMPFDMPGVLGLNDRPV